MDLFFACLTEEARHEAGMLSRLSASGSVFSVIVTFRDWILRDLGPDQLSEVSFLTAAVLKLVDQDTCLLPRRC